MKQRVIICSKNEERSYSMYDGMTGELTDNPTFYGFYNIRIDQKYVDILFNAGFLTVPNIPIECVKFYTTTMPTE